MKYTQIGDTHLIRKKVLDCNCSKQSLPVHTSKKLRSEAGGKDAIYLWVMMLGFPFKSLSWLIIY